MAVFAIDSPSLTRNTRKRKSEKLQFASFLIAERTVEIFAFKDSGHFRIFAEKSRDPKTRKFLSEDYFLLRERDTVADPCCELNVGNGRLKGCEWSDEEKNLVYEGWRNSGTKFFRIPADGESVFSTGYVKAFEGDIQLCTQRTR